jgi:hypothetical protein
MAKTAAEIAGIVDRAVAAAFRYDSDERSGDRSRAIDYTAGNMPDLPAEDGLSSIVSHDVADTMGWIMPGVMRVFTASDQLWDFEPETPADEEWCQQASDYINFLFWREQRGYRVLWNAIYDALQLRNGIVKVYWDDTPTEKIEMLTGISEIGLAELVNDEEVEVLAQTEREVLDVDPMTGEPVPYVVYDLKISRTCAYGKLVNESIPNEDFICSGAPDLEEDPVVGNRWRKTRSDLIEEGYDRRQVEELSGYSSGVDTEAEESARRGRNWFGSEDEGADRSMEEIHGVEVYLKIDVDDDGVAEVVRAVSAGEGEAGLLEWEVWEDDHPYVDLTGDPVPHRWQGRSVYDDTYDIQRVKTVLYRNLLDNSYQISFPDRVVNLDRVTNKDAVFDRSHGNQLFTNGDPNNVVANAEVAYVGDKILTTIQQVDAVLEMRTGVSRMSQALDPEALSNQTATAINAMQSAAYSKVELVVRNMAELGLKLLGRKNLKLIVKHQDRPRMVRLRDEWVEMDPRAWNADMDCTVNVGLGSGSRDRDFAMLTTIVQDQAAALLQVGPNHPYGLKLLDAYVVSQQKRIEAAGLRNPEMFWPALDDADKQAFAQPQPDPKLQELQMKSQMDAQKSQMDASLKQSELQQKAQIEQLQAEADIATKNREVEAQITLAREKFQIDVALMREKLAHEMRLKEMETQERIRQQSVDAQFQRQAKQEDMAFGQHQRAQEAEFSNEQRAQDAEFKNKQRTKDAEFKRKQQAAKPKPK